VIRWQKVCCKQCTNKSSCSSPATSLWSKHKIVSKSEGCVVDLPTIKPSAESVAWAKEYNLDARVIELALRESRTVIRRKNGVLITKTHHGFICANSGVDVSNVDGGYHAVLLPTDPDRSARRLHLALKKRTKLAIPVLITDSFGRPWREGLVDFCIGIAGINPLRDDRGLRDPHGYRLHASLEAVADELAAAAGLVCGQAQPHASLHHSRILVRNSPRTRERPASPRRQRLIPLGPRQREPLVVIWNTSRFGGILGPPTFARGTGKFSCTRLV
jgi:coenzyme F420-0:L-glutamate ligase / coenzyme F420-1:gamma-L-glutamate ligase